jgi:aspartate aminotransferase
VSYRNQFYSSPLAAPDFGILGEGYLRLSYANSTENILKALDRMGNFPAARKAA